MTAMPLATPSKLYCNGGTLRGYRVLYTSNTNTYVRQNLGLDYIPERAIALVIVFLSRQLVSAPNIY